MSKLGSVFDIHPVITPVDLQTGANTGDWINMANAQHAVLVFHSTVGTAADDYTITLLQAQDNAATGSKALNIPSGASTLAWKKQAATNLTGTSVWSDASGDVSTNTMTNATNAEQDSLVVIEIPGDILDADNGFQYVSITVADIGGNAQLGCAYMLLFGLRYPARPDGVRSPL